MSNTAPANSQRDCSAADVRTTLSALMPDISRYWQRPLQAFASVVYDVDPFRSDYPERASAMHRLAACIERAARRAGFSAEEAGGASRQILDSPVLQTGPHCLLVVEPDAFYTHLFSLLGLKAQGRKWHIQYAVSTTSYSESGKKGPGWLELQGVAHNLFGLPRRRMDGRSICCPNGPHKFRLTDPSNSMAPKASVARLLRHMPLAEFPSAAAAIKAANQALWRSKFGTPVNLLQLDDLDIADLLADHLEDAQSWMSAHFVGDGTTATAILDAIDELNAGVWRGWIRSTTDFFWRVNAGRVTPLHLHDRALKSEGPSNFQVPYDPASLAQSLRARRIVPNLFTVFLVMSILPGTRVLGGCRQTIYYPLMRYLASIATERSGNSDLLKALERDYRPGLWGHRTLKPANGAPLRELELAGSVAPLLATYAQLSLLQASDDLASFTKGAVWANLSDHVAAGTISAASKEWQWSGSR
jgi:hypothetical protein